MHKYVITNTTPVHIHVNIYNTTTNIGYCNSLFSLHIVIQNTTLLLIVINITKVIVLTTNTINI